MPSKTPAAAGGVTIIRADKLTWYERGDGAVTASLVTREVGATSLLSGITDFAPGGGIPLHTHNCDETVVVVDGVAQFEVEGAEHSLVPGDTSFVPAGIAHRFRNVSASQRLRILWTYGSIDATRTIVATGVTHRVGPTGDSELL